MKILQIHNYYQYKGGEDGVVEAEKRMLELFGHEVISLTAHNKSIESIFSERKYFYKTLNELLDSQVIDVAHIHNVYHIIGNDVYELLASKNISIVQTLHNFRFLCPAGTFMDNDNQICEKCSRGNFSYCVSKKCYQNSYPKSFLMQWFVKGGRKNILNYVSHFIALNDFYRNKYIEAGFDDKRIKIKPNFLFHSKIQNKITSENYALFIGRISPEKGLELLIDTFSEIPFSLKIVGTGEIEYMTKLKNKAKPFSNIEFCGFVDGNQKELLLSQCSLVVIPSVWYENFPMSILEAYSFKKPVIASNIGGLPSIVKNGETGLLFEAGNSISLKEAVIQMTANKQFIEMGQNSYQYFLANFTEEQNYEQLITIYHSAIAHQKNNK